MSNHAEERVCLLGAVNLPTGIEDFVPTVLGIGLRKHHEFDVTWITTQIREGIDQISHFVVGQRQSKFAVGDEKRLRTRTQNIHLLVAPCGGPLKERLEGVKGIHHHLGHSIMYERI